ncbi:MAG: radical SAM protein [Thermoguttaceae bacterium]
MYDFAPPRRRIYLRLSVTDCCSLRCRYCRPEGDVDWSGGHSSLPNAGRNACPTRPDIYPLDSNSSRASREELLAITELIAQEFHVYKVRLTGGEPLLAADPPDLVVCLRTKLPHLEEIGMTTNGLALRRYARSLRRAGLQSLNISLDTLDVAAYRHLTRGGRLTTVLDGIAAAREAGFDHLKLNAVLLRTINGDGLCDLVRFAARCDCEIRFIELMPCGEGAGLYATEFLSADEALTRLTAAFEYLGAAADSATARRHRLLVEGQALLVGFITAVSHPFCDTCDRLRVDCRGQLFSCLRSADGIDLLEPLRNGRIEEVRRRIRRGLAKKCIPTELWPQRTIAAIGG